MRNLKVRVIGVRRIYLFHRLKYLLFKLCQLYLFSGAHGVSAVLRFFGIFLDLLLLLKLIEGASVAFNNILKDLLFRLVWGCV